MAEDSDFSRLVRDLGEVPASSGRFLRKAIEVTAIKVKTGWQDRLKGSKYVPHGARSITYDIKGVGAVGGSELSAEIGAQKGRKQAFFVSIIETGSPTSSPHGYGLAALQDNEADFEHGIELAIDDALKAAGL